MAMAMMIANTDIGRLTPDSVCNSCLARLSLHTTTQQIRSAATAAAVVAPTSSTTSTSSTDSTTPATQQTYQLRASVVLSRPPILTRPLHPFEKAFFFYQRRLNERLALPFTRYFYYKKGTPADRDWKRKRDARGGAAVRDIGVYNAYGSDAWNDELLVGDKTSEPEEQVEALIRDVEGVDIPKEEGMKEGAGDVVVARPLPRRTEADEKGDLTRLDRKLDGTLYLLVKNKDGKWRFPEGAVEGKEGLHEVSSMRNNIQPATTECVANMVDRPPSASLCRRAAST